MRKAIAVLASGDIKAICRMMVGLAYHDPDWRWVQGHCLRLSSHDESQLRYISAICILHLARIHKKLDLDEVRPMLLRLTTDSDWYVRGATEDAIGDIEWFMQVKH